MATKDALDRFTFRARIRPLSRDPSKPRLGRRMPACASGLAVLESVRSGRSRVKSGDHRHHHLRFEIATVTGRLGTQRHPGGLNGRGSQPGRARSPRAPPEPRKEPRYCCHGLYSFDEKDSNSKATSSCKFPPASNEPGEERDLAVPKSIPCSPKKIPKGCMPN
jgi:hypothetical protein